MTIRTFPAITMWQPWATLLVDGHKRHETRPQPIPAKHVGKWVAIHSAARSVRPYELKPGLRHFLDAYYGRSYETGFDHRQVVGLVRFGAAFSTSEEDGKRGYLPGTLDWECGDWGSGRFAWPVLERINVERVLGAFITGRQGWFSVEIDVPPGHLALDPGTPAIDAVGEFGPGSLPRVIA